MLAALLIASKVEDEFPLGPQELSELSKLLLSDHKGKMVSKDSILALEILILRTLEFRLHSHNTLYDKLCSVFKTMLFANEAEEQCTEEWLARADQALLSTALESTYILFAQE